MSNRSNKNQIYVVLEFANKIRSIHKSMAGAIKSVEGFTHKDPAYVFDPRYYIWDNGVFSLQIITKTLEA
jgi:hypothetical protein